MRKLLQASTLAALGLMGLANAAHAGCTFELKADLPVTMRGTRPITPVKVNGADLDFLVDSGAFFSIIIPSKAAELKLKPAYARGDITGIGGSNQMQVVDAESFSVGGRSLHDYQFVVTGGVGPGVAGVIGQNLLIAGDVEYDLAGGKIRVMQPKDCGDSPLAYWAAGKPFNAITVTVGRLGAPHTAGMVYINGKQLRVLFDTGASTSVLRLEAARRLGLAPDTAGAQEAGYSRGIGPHLVRTWIVPVADFRIGDEEVKNTHLRIGDTTEGGDFDMLLGADFFLSHHILIANSQRKLYFTYNGGPVFDLTMGAAAPPPAPPEASPKPN